MENKVKLTSVNILEDKYKEFKVITINEPINLQKLVNRAIDLYMSDEDFKKKINEHNNLSSSNSKF